MKRALFVELGWSSIRRTTLVIAAVTMMAVSGCQTVPVNEGAPASVSDVMSKIKEDLAKYQDYDAVASAAPAENNECKGIVGFSIDNIQVQLTTKTDTTSTGTAEATLPVGAVTFGPSLSASQEAIGTQTMTFSIYPKPVPVSSQNQAKPAAIDGNRYPIAASLQQLREGLLKASYKKPCISLVPAAKKDDPGGTFEFGFTVVNQTTAGANLKFVVFSLGATASSQRSSGNTIRVTFKARAGDAAVY